MNNVLQRIMNKVHYKFPLTEQKVVRSLVARKMTGTGQLVRLQIGPAPGRKSVFTCITPRFSGTTIGRCAW